MRRFRNPRYAPEGLERKLNPSGIGIPVTAEIASTSAAPTLAESPAASPNDPFVVASATIAGKLDPPPTNPLDPLDPGPGTGSPPSGGPPCPTGPVEPDVA